MASDMLRQIEMELAKREKGKQVDTPWWAQVATDAIRDIPRQQERARVWQERKNEQRQKIMNNLAKDTRRMYNNEDAELGKKRYQEYYDKIKGTEGVDEYTIELGAMHLKDFDIQIDKNKSFMQYESRLDSEMDKVMKFVNEFGREEEYSEEDYDKKLDEFRNVVDVYTKYTE